MGKRIYKKQIIRTSIVDGKEDVFESIQDAALDSHLAVSSIYRCISKNKSFKGYSFRYGEAIKTREKYKIRKPYFLLVSECDEVKNPNVWDTRICPICGNKFYVRKRYKRIVCSNECHNKYMELYGNEINERKRKKGYEIFYSKTKEQINAEHEKARKTCLEKYGIDMYQKTPEYREKMSKMFLEKDWSERSKKTNESLIPKYKEICEKDDLELIEFRNRFDCTVKCKKCGNVFDVHILGYLTEKTNSKLCRHCHPNSPNINTEPMKFIENILKENNIEFIKNDRIIIKPFEIDLLVPSLNVGFEINGNYWHSEVSGGKDKNYHLNKTKNAFKKGIKLIQIFEDEILIKPNIVYSRILNILGLIKEKIYARKCSATIISGNDKKIFLNENHIDGDSLSKYNYGLFYNNELVSVATFGERKISGKKQFELIRFANKINTNVIGAFSKLLYHFMQDYKPDKLVTYADIRWSGMDPKNTVYFKNGFNFIGYTTPNYFYLDKKKYTIRINRLNFTKQKLIKRGFDKTKTEIQLMLENGYDRIWNCGSMKFEYIIT